MLCKSRYPGTEMNVPSQINLQYIYMHFFKAQIKSCTKSGKSFKTETRAWNDRRLLSVRQKWFSVLWMAICFFLPDITGKKKVSSFAFWKSSFFVLFSCSEVQLNQVFSLMLMVLVYLSYCVLIIAWLLQIPIYKYSVGLRLHEFSRRRLYIHRDYGPKNKLK